jgi:hypothetical protein
MGLQPSASRTDLLLACPRPFDVELEDADASSQAARYGSAFHAVIAACLKSPKKKPLERALSYAKMVDKAAATFDVRSTAAELAGHVKGSVKVLRNWLEREKLEVAAVEEARAVRPRADGSWDSAIITPHDEDHRYDVESEWMPGTVDLVARDAARTRTVVLDHKTGGGDDDGFARPASLPQMRTLGLSARLGESTRSRHGPLPEIEVGIFHADRQGLPIVYAEPYERSEQRVHARELNEALSRLGQGFMRVGAHCKWCPARPSCPAHITDLISEGTASLVQAANKFAVEPISPTALYVRPAEAPLSTSIEERAGALYDLLKRFRELEKFASSEIKRLVREGAVIETRDGKVLTIQEQTFETLSKKSVIEALGKVVGERELARLRKKGAIREAKREMLVPEK